LPRSTTGAGPDIEPGPGRLGDDGVRKSAHRIVDGGATCGRK
jgi:hypothetical protein